MIPTIKRKKPLPKTGSIQITVTMDVADVVKLDAESDRIALNIPGLIIGRTGHVRIAVRRYIDAISKIVNEK